MILVGRARILTKLNTHQEAQAGATRERERERDARGYTGNGCRAKSAGTSHMCTAPVGEQGALCVPNGGVRARRAVCTGPWQIGMVRAHAQQICTVYAHVRCGEQCGMWRNDPPAQRQRRHGPASSRSTTALRKAETRRSCCLSGQTWC